MSNSDIAREVAYTIATHETPTITGWKWRTGVILFPEARCPFCKLVMRSKAVWLVDGNYLIGQAVPQAGRELVLDKPSHPHATPSAICMGDATDPLQALFCGLNLESSYIEPIPWLKGKYWEHSCAEMGASEEDEDEDEDEDDYTCGSCSRGMSEDDYYIFNDSYYCQRCFYERAFFCETCEEIISIDDYYTAFDDSYCVTCFDGRFFNCLECCKTFRLSDRTNDKNYCSECYEWLNWI